MRRARRVVNAKNYAEKSGSSEEDEPKKKKSLVENDFKKDGLSSSDDDFVDPPKMKSFRTGSSSSESSSDSDDEASGKAKNTSRALPNKKRTLPNKNTSNTLPNKKTVNALPNKKNALPNKPNLSRLQAPKVASGGGDSSSSESDIENYLTRPEELDLNSEFFQKEQCATFSQIERNIFEDVKRLSDSESDDDTPKENIEQQNEVTKDDAPKATFQQLSDFCQKIEQAKMHVEKYEARKKNEKEQEDISELLNAGEKNAWNSPEIVNRVKSGLVDRIHTSEFGSDSEKEDWEDVEHSEHADIIPKNGVEITVQLPDAVRKKKGVDLIAMMKRSLNRIKRENQVYVHRVHLLCWIAHGNFVNNVLNKESLLAVALSLLPSQHCYPSGKTDFKYLEGILGWYRRAINNVEITTPKDVPLDESLAAQFDKKQAHDSRMYVYMFVCVLRALGVQCRLVMSVQVEPLRPPASELQVVNTKSTKDGESNKDSNKTKSSEGKKKEERVGEKKKQDDKIKVEKRNTEKLKVSTERKTKDDKPPITTEMKKKQDKVPVKTETKKMQDKVPANKNQDKRKLTMEANNKEDKLPEVKKKQRTLTEEEKNKEGKLNVTIEEKEAISKQCSKKPTAKTITKLINIEDSKKSDEVKNNGVHKTRGRSKRKSVDEDEPEEKIPKIKNNPRGKTVSTSVNKQKDSKRKPIAKSRDDKNEKPPDKTARGMKLRHPLPKLENDLNDYIATLENLEKPTVKVERSEAIDKTNGSNPVDEQTSSSEDEEMCVEITQCIKKPQLGKLTLNDNISEAKNVPQIDGVEDCSSDDCESLKSILQLDGNNDDDDKPSTSKHPSLHKLARNPETRNRLPRLNIPKHAGDNSEDDRSPFARSNLNAPRVNLTRLRESEVKATNKPPQVKLSKLKLSRDAESEQQKPSGSGVKLPGSKSNISPVKMRAKTARNQSKMLDVRNDIMGLVKSRMNEQRHADKAKLVKGKRAVRDEDSDSDYAPMPVVKKLNTSKESKVKVKRRIPPKSVLERKVFTSDDEAGPSTAKSKSKKKGVDIWVEVFLESEEKWICADVVKGQVHCVKELFARATQPISYILAWDNTNRVKDVTQRYCANWNTVTKKLRTDQKWWEQSLAPFVGKKTARDKEEDADFIQQQLEQPLPKTISEYKDHHLYVLPRHLLKFQAIYPPDAVPLGYIRNEPVYSRHCVYTLHSREIWLKEAKVVKIGEKPYKIVKARPKWDKLSNTVIKDQLLEVFGQWQVGDYEPPTAENGIVPRNAYGNVELYKACMLPKGTVHLNLPGLNKVARKMQIDCAPAVVGFDFHSGFSHPTFDGFVVCEEFSETLTAAWCQEQEEQQKREKEKYEKRVYGNWKKLIKGLLIRERLKARYDFGGEVNVPPIPKPPEQPEAKPKGPRFIINRKKK